MATVFYIPRDTAFAPSPDSFTPAIEGTWQNDFAITYWLAAAADAIDDTSAYLLRTISSAAVAETYVHGLAYSWPMQTTHAWTTAVTCNFVCGCSEGLSTMNAFTLWNLGVISNDGATVHWQTSNMKDGSEMPTSTASRNNNAGYTAGADYTNVPGDRVFVEFGYDKDAAVAGDLTQRFGYSDTAGDLTTTDGDTGVQNSWFQVSHTITFDPEGTVYPEGQSRFMLMGVG